MCAECRRSIWNPFASGGCVLLKTKLLLGGIRDDRAEMLKESKLQWEERKCCSYLSSSPIISADGKMISKIFCQWLYRRVKANNIKSNCFVKVSLYSTGIGFKSLWKAKI